MKNVVIVNDFSYVQGGASKVAIDTANALSKKGIKVYFFSGDSKDISLLDENIIVVSTNQTEALKDKNKIRGLFNGIYNVKAKRLLKKLLCTLGKNDTIIHVHGWTKCLSSSVFHIAFKMRFKVVLTLHDYFTACPNGGYFNYCKNQICTFRPLSGTCLRCNCDSRNYIFKVYRIIRQFVQNKIVKLNDRLEYAISISDFSERILQKNLNKKINVVRIYNPVEMKIDNKKREFLKNEYYLYVGRISKEKGVDVFCKSLVELGLNGIVVGEGPQKEELRKQYPCIEFVGWKSSEDVKEYMMNAKALIFPSLWYETAGLTAIEAKMVGLPVFVSDVSCAREFIDDGVDGLWFNPNDINDLKDKIMKYENGSIQFKVDSTNIKNNMNFEKYIENIKLFFDGILKG